MMLAVIALLAFSTRLLPLSISQYPFNSDALTECAIASDILDTGRIEFSPDRFYYTSHTAITVAYDVLLAFVAAVTGFAPLDIAQLTVAVGAVISVCGVYLIAIQMTKNRGSALAAAVVVALFGTLVYLTGSAWKMSLGFAFLVILYYAYMNRTDHRMFGLEVVTMSLLVLTHHVVALLALLFLGYLTVWSVFVAARKQALRRQHLLDFAFLLLVGVGALFYYWVRSLDRLSVISSGIGLAAFAVAFLITCVAVIIVLSKQTHVRGTFAPVLALLVFGLFVYDYFSPIFPHAQGAPVYVLILGASYAVLVLFAWVGVEVAIESGSVYRAVPLGMVLPVATVVLFALFRGLDEASHQIIYRVFDFAGLGLAVGVSIAVQHLVGRPRAKAFVVGCILVALVISFPYGYASGDLIGVRHDTQQYEVDAFGWLAQTLPDDYSVRSDDRLSYIGMAVHYIDRKPYLPLMLLKEVIYPLNDTVLVMEEEWMSVGVNDFPRGRYVYTEEHIAGILSYSNVLYVGGPVSNKIIAFEVSASGLSAVLNDS